MRFVAVMASFIVALGAFTTVSAQEPTAENFKKTGSADFDDTVSRFLNKETPKIVGGKPATPGAYPWQASLVVANISDTGRAHFCGGSVYNAKWIVTAAHCLKGVSASQFNVIVGTYTLDNKAKRYSVRRRIIHGSYNKLAPSDSDVALIELENPLEIGEPVQAVPVLDPKEEPKTLVEGANLVVTGWGATMQGGNAVRDLREVTVPFVTQNDCRDPLSYGNQITDNMICAGLAIGGKDSCRGDSGGPLVSTSTPRELVGVVSWGEGCARPGKFGVYTRISKFKAWIESCVAGGPCPESK